MIKFLLNDQQINIDNLPADTTLLDFLRDHKHLCGTKEGCASGDCGACTVAIAQPNALRNGLDYKAVNSCITLLSAVEGKQVISVEHLESNGQLHPVQQAMLEQHGSQCGFCTPGFVMSLFCLYQKNSKSDRKTIDTALSGNLCRCTGYRPIIDAAMQSCQPHKIDKFAQQTQHTLDALECIASSESTSMGGLVMPRTRTELAKAMSLHPDAILVAGSTDVALLTTQEYKDLSVLISVSNVSELNCLECDEHGVLIGSALPFSQFQDALLMTFPALNELVERFASLPIRNQATLGGNVANASPIGDMPPVLLALDATVMLDNGETKRTVPATEFFTGYRQTQLKKNEWIEAIYLPKPLHHQLRAYKVSKRNEDDISAVCAVFNLQLEQGKVVQLKTGFGGVAATPVACLRLQNALVGKRWSDESLVELGSGILFEAFEPIDDVRASASYRKRVLANLWKRFWLETQANNRVIETRVVQHA